MGTFYVTTPIYYANDFPHIGSAYTTIAADVLARYHRRRGDDTFFLTGTDEHGAKVAEAAAQQGLDPKAFTDRIAAGFKAAWHSLNISNDYFVRTTDVRHEAGVQAFLQTLFDRGEIYRGKYEGLYCVGCEAYVAPEDLVDGLCPVHRRPPIVYSEDNYFFRLSKYGDILQRAITSSSDPNHYQIGPAARRNEVLGKIRVGLSDISISRAALTWGIPLPFDPSQTAYVWIDALLNYITAAGYHDDPETFSRLWPGVNLIGKDILWFHAVIWPAMLIAAGQRPPKLVYAHGFFTINGQKMSKSLGNVIVPSELIERFGFDGSRYLLVSEFPFGVDGDVSVASFVARYNAELANDLGNLLNRTVSMVNRYFYGEVPNPGPRTEHLDDEIEARANRSVGEYFERLDALDFPGAITAIRDLVTRANRYVEETSPWTLAKSDRERLAPVIYNLAESLRIAAELIWPFMPDAAEAMLEQLGTTLAAGGWPSGALGWGHLPVGTRVARAQPLFPRLEPLVAP